MPIPNFYSYYYTPKIDKSQGILTAQQRPYFTTSMEMEESLKLPALSYALSVTS